MDDKGERIMFDPRIHQYILNIIIEKSNALENWKAATYVSLICSTDCREQHMASNIATKI